MSLSELTRRQVRYWLFRFQTELEGGSTVSGAPDGLRGHFEALMWFPGWLSFGKTWDVDESNQLAMCPIEESLARRWADILEKSTQDISVVIKRLPDGS